MSSTSRDLTFLLEDMKDSTPGVLMVVHAATDGILRHAAGADRDSAERIAAALSSIRAAALQLSAEAEPDSALAPAPFEHLTFQIGRTSTSRGKFVMAMQPADGALLGVVADESCVTSLLAQEMARTGKSVASHLATQTRDETAL